MKTISRPTFSLRVPILALFALIAAPAAVQAQVDWVTFQSEQAGFSVEMPAQPTTSKTVTDSFIGDVTNDIFTARDANQKMTVDYSKIPRFALDFAGAGTIYSHAKGALLKQTWSKEVSFTDVTTHGHKGKRLVYDTPPIPGKPKIYGEAHFFLIGDRFYVVDAAVPADDTESVAKRFLASIRFDE